MPAVNRTFVWQNWRDVLPIREPICCGVCRKKVCARTPPPSSALFACVPNPRHLVWVKSGSGRITICLRPFWWLILNLARHGSLCRIFHASPSCWKGTSSSVFALFLHPLNSLCAPPYMHQNPLSAPFLHALFCAGSPFLHPFCTEVFAPRHFARRAPNLSTKVQSWFLKRTCSAFVF